MKHAKKPADRAPFHRLASPPSQPLTRFGYVSAYDLELLQSRVECG